MKRSFKYYAAAWAVLVVVFNVVAFVVPIERTGGFWVAYLCIMAAFIGQLVCANMAFKAENKEKMFLSLPLINESYLGLVVMGIVGIVCTLIPNCPTWVAAVACVVVLGFSAISVIKAAAIVEPIAAIDKKIKVQTFFIKSLTVDVDSLMSRTGSDDAKAELRKVYEAVRYSDPMSDDALSGIESQITLKFAELTEAVEQNPENIAGLAKQMIALVEDRNKKCKILK